MLKRLTKNQKEKFDEIAAEAERALKKSLGDRLEIKAVPGYQGRVQLELTSNQLNTLTEREKQELLWSILQRRASRKSRLGFFHYWLWNRQRDLSAAGSL